MKVAELMTRAPYCCGVNDNLRQAAEKMAKHELGCLPVVDGAGKLVGLVTDRDVCVAAGTERGALDDRPVSSQMSPHPLACRPDANLRVASELMRAHGVRRLVVTNDEGDVEGLLSLDDLAHARTLGADLTSDEIAETLAAVSPRRTYGS